MEPGTALVNGTVFATTGQALDRRLDELARTVCPDDPRTLAQRRADALGALAAGQDRLACGCERADCPAGSAPRQPSSVLIHVVADRSTIDGSGAAPGFLYGDGIIPAEMVRELAKQRNCNQSQCRNHRNLGTRRLGRWQSLCEPATSPAGRRVVTGRPPSATSTTPLPTLTAGRPIRRTSNVFADNIICSKPSGADPTAGAICNTPTALSRGRPPADTRTPPDRAVGCCYPACTCPPANYPLPQRQNYRPASAAS
jgi:hypothetical protein